MSDILQKLIYLSFFLLMFVKRAFEHGIFICLILLSCVAFFSNNAIAKINSSFLSRWVASDLQTFKDEKGNSVEVIGFQRFVPLKQKPFAIGNIITMSVDEKSAQFSANEFKLQMIKAFGIPKFKMRKIEENGAKVFVYEGFWKKIKQGLKIFVSSFKGKRIVSFALYRHAYGGSFYFESEFIQRDLTGPMKGTFLPQKLLFSENANAKKNTEIASLSSYILQLFISKSYADGFPNTGPLPTVPPLPTAPPIPGDLGDYVPDSPGDIPGLPDWAGGGPISACGITCDPASPGFSSCLQDIAVCKSDGLKDSIGSLLEDTGLKDMVKDLKGSASEVSNSINNISKSIDGATAEAKRMNDFIGNNSKLFAAGFSLTAGMAMGGSVVGLGMQALGVGWDLLYEAITNEKDNARRIEMFEKAREKWENMNSVAFDLQKQIDSMLLLKDLAVLSKKDREKMLLEIHTDLESKKNKKERLTKQLNKMIDIDKAYEADNADSSVQLESWNQIMGCQPQYDLEAQIGSLAKEIGTVESTLNRLKKFNDESENPEENMGIDTTINNFCRDLEKYTDKLRLMESEMQDLRGILVDVKNQGLFFEKLNAQVKDAQKGYDSINSEDQITKSLRKTIDSQQALYDNQESAFYKKREDFITWCTSQKVAKSDVPIFGPIINGIEHASDFSDIKAGCAEEFDKGPKFEALRTNLLNAKIGLGQTIDSLNIYKATLKKERTNAAQYVLTVAQDRVKLYTKWFTDLVKESSCYSQAQACNGKIDENKCLEAINACNDLSKDSRSLLLNFRNLARRSAKIDQICK